MFGRRRRVLSVLLLIYILWLRPKNRFRNTASSCDCKCARLHDLHVGAGGSIDRLHLHPHHLHLSQGAQQAEAQQRQVSSRVVNPDQVGSATFSWIRNYLFRIQNQVKLNRNAIRWIQVIIAIQGLHKKLVPCYAGM